jgi:hypothetical protein
MGAEDDRRRLADDRVGLSGACAKFPLEPCPRLALGLELLAQAFRVTLPLEQITRRGARRDSLDPPRRRADGTL